MVAGQQPDGQTAEGPRMVVTYYNPGSGNRGIPEVLQGETEVGMVDDATSALAQEVQDSAQLFGQGVPGGEVSDLSGLTSARVDQDDALDEDMEETAVVDAHLEVPVIHTEDNDSHQLGEEEPTFAPSAHRSQSPPPPCTPEHALQLPHDEQSHTPTFSPPLPSPTLLGIPRSDFHIDSFGFTFHTLVIDIPPPLLLASEISPFNVPNYEHRNHYNDKRYNRTRYILEKKLAGIKVVGPQDKRLYLRNRSGQPPLRAREVLGLYECEHWPGVDVQLVWTSWLIESAQAYLEGRRYPKLPNCALAVYQSAFLYANQQWRRAEDDWLLQTVLNMEEQRQLIRLSKRLGRNAVKDSVLLPDRQKPVQYVRLTLAVYRVDDLKMPTDGEKRQRTVQQVLDQWGAEAIAMKSKVSKVVRSKKRVPDWIGGSGELTRSADGDLNLNWKELHEHDVLPESFAARPTIKAWPPGPAVVSVPSQLRDQTPRTAGARNEGSAVQSGPLSHSNNSACPGLQKSSNVLGKGTISSVDFAEHDQTISKRARLAPLAPRQRQTAAMAEPQDIDLAAQTQEEPSVEKVQLQHRDGVLVPMSYPPAPGREPPETSELMIPPSASTRQILAGPRVTPQDFARPVTLDPEVLRDTRAKVEAFVTQIQRYQKRQRQHIYCIIASIPAWNTLSQEHIMEKMMSYHDEQFQHAEDDWRRLFNIQVEFPGEFPLRRQCEYLSCGLKRANIKLLTATNRELFMNCCEMEAFKLQLEVMKEWTANLDVMRFNYVQKKGNMLFRHEEGFTIDLKHMVNIADDAVVKDREMEG